MPWTWVDTDRLEYDSELDTEQDIQYGIYILLLIDITYSYVYHTVLLLRCIQFAVRTITLVNTLYKQAFLYTSSYFTHQQSTHAT